MNIVISKILQLCERPLKPQMVVKDKYRIFKFLGKGSYGFTYLVKDDSGEFFVLKQLRTYKKLDKAGKDALKLEAENLKTFDYPGFPKFYDHFIENRFEFIVMEFKKGKTFEQLIFNDKLLYTEKKALLELYHILRLVRLIHIKGYVHCDLRIPNIIKDGRDYYIIDFGLAQKVQSQILEQKEWQQRTKRQLFREASFKSDFYALGHFLLFLLYSTYVPVSSKQRSWEVELDLSVSCKRILRKMLQLEEPYNDIQLLMKDIKDCICSEEKACQHSLIKYY